MDGYDRLACEALPQEGLSGEPTQMGEGISLIAQQAADDGVRDKGRYLTLKLDNHPAWDEDVAKAVAAAIRRLLAANNLHPKHTLVVGLGNREVLCDRLGSATVSTLSPTPQVMLICPMVEASTGIPTADVVGALCQARRPDLVLTVDTLVCNRPEHLMRTAQLWDAGFRPGGGVGKTCKALNRHTLGVPVLSVGVPMLSFVQPFDPRLCVTTQDVELQLPRIAATLASGIHLALTASA